jgi:hypothetical protein
MMRLRGLFCGLVVVVGGVGSGAVAAAAQQQGERAPAASVRAELRGLAGRAGVVFVGQVAKIEPMDGVVEITFTVEQPVLGVVGGSYVMREWAGRWTGGREDFEVGQRAMFFLHAPGALGLSSAVDGMIGVVPVVPMGANGAALLDVRWLATRVRRTVGVSLAGAAESSTGGIALADGIAVARGWKAEGLVELKGVRLPEGVVAPVQSSVGSEGMRAGQSAGVVSAKEAGDAQR